MKIPKRIASAVINSLKGGVVPRIGLPTLLWAENWRSMRCFTMWISSQRAVPPSASLWKYGSGKSFLLQTIRSHVMDRNFVVVDATFHRSAGYRAPRDRDLPPTKS